MYFVYIYEAERYSKSGGYQVLLYTGITNNITRRWKEHCTRRYGWAKIAKVRPLRIVYVELVKTKEEAEKREKEIKRMSRDKKYDLIVKRGNPKGYSWNDLVELCKMVKV